MSSKTDKGKWAEKKLREYLKKLSESRTNFAFDRIPDAKSSRGRSGARPSDFAAFVPGRHVWLETKETKKSDSIPKSSIPQIPMLRIRALAGGLAIILIFHSETKLWRCPDFQFFVDNQGKTGSYDVKTFPTYKTVEEALNTCHGEIFYERSIR